MAEKRTIELEVKESGFKSLKAQLREAQADVAALSDKFGATSDQAIAAAKAAAILKDTIGDAKTLTDAYNPDAKFKALTGSLSGAANGFQAVQGAMGLVGVESAAVEETLLKVQSAMAFAQGIDGVLESVDSFKTLAKMLGIVRTAKAADTVVTATQATVTNAASVATGKMTLVQKALNLVMKANPIFLIISALTALVAAYVLFSGSQETAEDANNKLNASLEKQLELTESIANESKRRNDKALELLRVQGASEEDLHLNKLRNMALEKYYRNAQISEELYAIDEKNRLYKKALKEENFELAKTIREETEAIREKYKDLKTANKNYYDDVKIENAKFSQDEIDKQNKIAEEAQRKADAAAEKRKEKRNAELDELNKFTADAAKLNSDILKNEQQIELEAIENKYKDQITLAVKYGKNTTELTNAQGIEERKVKQKYIQQEIEEIDAIVLKKYETSDLSIETLKSQTEVETAIKKEARDKDFAADKEVAAAQIALANLTRDQKIEAAQAVSNTFSQLANLLGEQTAAGKAAAIAAATIETFLSAQKAYSATVGIPIVGPVLAPINAGIAIAAGIKNIKAITSVKTPNGGGGGAGNLPTAPSGGGGVSAPNFNIVGNSGINQLAELGGQPIQAYVVSGEVTSAQALDRNRIQNATF